MPRKDLKHYWQDRIAERNERLLKLTNRRTKELLRQLYEEQGLKLKASIEETFLKIMKDSADGKIYMNDLYRTNAYHTLLGYFNECGRAIGAEQVTITEQALIDVYNQAQEAIEKQVPQKLKPSKSFLVPTAIDAKQAVHQTWVLDGKEFSDRIWQNKKALVEDLTRTMADSIGRGESPYSIAEGIMKRLDVDEYCAFRIARTETAHAQVKGQIDKYKQMGFSRGKFRGVDPCDMCHEHDGEEYSLDELEHMIPRHPNCECSFDLVIEEVKQWKH